MEDFPEDLTSLLGLCQQEIQKFPLGDHGHPGELGPVQTHDATNSGSHILGPRHRRTAIGKGQLSIRLLLHQLAPPLGRTKVFGIPSDGVGLPPTLEGQLHKGGGRRVGIGAAEHGGLPIGPAGLPIQSKGHTVKNAGFPGTCVTGDQVQAPLAQPGEVDDGLFTIGTEG